MSAKKNEPLGTGTIRANQPEPLWRNRDYLLLWSGQAISTLGSQTSQLAFPLLVLFLTASPALAGITGALHTLPYVFLSLPVGTLIDRWDRRRVMILCDTGRALSLGSIPLVYALFGRVPLVQLYLAALIEGTLFVFFNLAEVACLPRIVSKQQLAAAAGQNEAAEHTAVLIGPLVSGVLYGLARSLPFLVDAISYAISVGSLALIRTPFQEQRSSSSGKLRQEIAEGLIWIWHHPLIRFLALLNSGLNFVLSGLTLIIIIIAQRQGASSAVIGGILSVGAIGGIAGSLLVSSIQKRFRIGSIIIGTCWAWALLWPLYAVVPSVFALALLSVVFFLIEPLFNIVQYSYRLTLIPDALQGRVNSVFRLFAFGLSPLGFTLTGVLLQEWGVVPTIVLFGVCFVLLAIWTALNPHLRAV